MVNSKLTIGEPLNRPTASTVKKVFGPFLSNGKVGFQKSR